MSNINNQWVREHQSLVYRLLREIEEYEMQGSYGGGLNLTLIRKVISDAFKEINNLQNQVDILKASMSKREAEIKKFRDMLEKAQKEAGQDANPV